MLMMIRTKCLSYIYDYLWYLQLEKRTEKDIVEKNVYRLYTSWLPFGQHSTTAQKTSTAAELLTKNTQTVMIEIFDEISVYTNQNE